MRVVGRADESVLLRALRRRDVPVLKVDVGPERDPEEDGHDHHNHDHRHPEGLERLAHLNTPLPAGHISGNWHLLFRPYSTDTIYLTSVVLSDPAVNGDRQS